MLCTVSTVLRSRLVNTLDRTGVFGLVTRVHSHDLLVLGYHSILERQHPQPFRYHHTAEEFAAHLEWLGRHCEPVGLDGVRKWLEESGPPASLRR